MPSTHLPKDVWARELVSLKRYGPHMTYNIMSSGHTWTPTLWTDRHDWKHYLPEITLVPAYNEFWYNEHPATTRIIMNSEFTGQLVVTTTRQHAFIMHCVFDSLECSQALSPQKLITVVTKQSVGWLRLKMKSYNTLAIHLNKPRICVSVSDIDSSVDLKTLDSIYQSVQETDLDEFCFDTETLDLLHPLYGIHTDIFHKAQANIFCDQKNTKTFNSYVSDNLNVLWLSSVAWNTWALMLPYKNW